MHTFTYLVVDLGVALSEATLTVLERASHILLIVTPELTAMKDTKDLFRSDAHVHVSRRGPGRGVVGGHADGARTGEPHPAHRHARADRDEGHERSVPI